MVDFWLGYIYALIAGIMSIVLLVLSIQRKNDKFFIFSMAFLLVSWSGLEWALFLQGENLFKLVYQPIVPLTSYFLAWTLFVIFIAERYFKRLYWLLFLTAIAAISVIAHYCFDCL